jgi:hypothetical protein
VRAARRTRRAVVLGAALAAAGVARAEPPADGQLSDAAVLGATDHAVRVESVMTHVSIFDQDGHGYQSQAGPVLGAGSERARIFEAQTEVVLSQGPRLTHRIWIPVDLVTAASPDALDDSRPDVVSEPSRHVTAAAIDVASTYKASRVLRVTVENGVHLEQPFRSWNTMLGVSRSFADEATTLSANVGNIYDWLDLFDVQGLRHGITSRTSTTASVGVTQVLTPTTVVHADYGWTLQAGTLGNTWNSVPLESGVRGPELLPDRRSRHALVGRASQFLPWNGALRLYYRLYADDWSLVAHSIEGQLAQRLSPEIYVAALYRFHTQDGVSFFTTLAAPSAPLRTADSDLAPLGSHTVGGRIVADVPLRGEARTLHFELAYERYWRTNDLWMNVFTCATGVRF